jgi:hypothetical protein
MKNLVGALLALFLVPACSGEAEQVPGPQAPPPAPPPDTTTTMTETATATATATTPPPAPKPPLADLERNAIKGMIAAFNAHDPRQLASLYAPDAVVGAPALTGWAEARGRDAIESSHKALFAVFPDLKWASPRVYLKGNVVVQEWVSVGTHSAAAADSKATNKPTGVYGASVYWFNDDGLIERDHTYYDAGTVGVQIGAQKGQARAIPTLDAAEPQLIVATGSPDDDKWVPAARALYSAFGGKDQNAFLSGFTKNVVRITYSQPTDRTGTDAAKQDYQAVLKAFPDIKNSLQNAWGFGDRVVVETVMSGTHTGALGTIKATKRPVTLHSLDILKFDPDGKVTEMYSYASNLELMGQLGVLGNEKAATGTGTGGSKSGAGTGAPGTGGGGGPGTGGGGGKGTGGGKGGGQNGTTTPPQNPTPKK